VNPFSAVLCLVRVTGTYFNKGCVFRGIAINRGRGAFVYFYHG